MAGFTRSAGRAVRGAGGAGASGGEFSDCARMPSIEVIDSCKTRVFGHKQRWPQAQTVATTGVGVGSLARGDA